MTIFSLILATLTAVLPNHPTYTEIPPCEATQAGQCVMSDEGTMRLIDDPDARTHLNLAACPNVTRLFDGRDLCYLTYRGTYYLKITRY